MKAPVFLEAVLAVETMYLPRSMQNILILYTFFYRQPSCEGCNIKNGLKVKELLKQPPTLIQKKLLELSVNNLTSSILKSDSYLRKKFVLFASLKAL